MKHDFMLSNHDKEWADANKSKSLCPDLNQTEEDIPKDISGLLT